MAHLCTFKQMLCDLFPVSARRFHRHRKLPDLFCQFRQTLAYQNFAGCHPPALNLYSSFNKLRLARLGTPVPASKLRRNHFDSMPRVR